MVSGDSVLLGGTVVLQFVRKLDQWEAKIMPHGRITFLIGILFMVLGYINWPSECHRGQTAPGAYEQRQIVPGENPAEQAYDSWVNQLQRRQERGR